MNYTINRLMAILGGAGAATLSVVLLTKGTRMSEWTVDMWATASLVPLVVVAAVIGHSAASSGRVVTGLLLAGLSAIGSGLVVFENLGNRAEIREAKVLVAEASNAKLTREQERLSEHEYILASCPAGVPRSHVGRRCGLRDAMVEECKSGDGSRCRGLMRSVKVYEDAIVGIASRADAVASAPLPIDAQAHRLASLASWLDVKLDVSLARAVAADAHGLGVPLFLDLGAILLLIWGLDGARNGGRNGLSPRSHLQPESDSGALKEAPEPARDILVRDDAIARIVAMLERGETWSSQEELRAKLGLSREKKGSLSRILAFAERSGQIPRRVQSGRCKSVESCK